MGLNGNSACGNSHADSVTGVPDPLGARPGEPHPWNLLAVIW